MRIGRTIVAVLVALAVATLPAATGFAAGATTAMEISASQAMPDCDHHQDIPSNTTQKSTDGCDSMAGCALKCFTTTVVSFSSLTFLSSPSAALEPVRLENKVTSRIGSPPFRPPRI